VRLQDQYVEAGISLAYRTLTASSANVSKSLSWGGGSGNLYNVSYYDGITTKFSDSSANYYSTSVTTSYSLGVLSTKTWNNTLRVSTLGGSDTAYGSVTLKRQ